ncbi:MAG: hypothetical protein LBV53_01705 [Mycoplasmataceae bacterium]|nr:hypothetical protein [Mycoplasmataceae bacterium]
MSNKHNSNNHASRVSKPPLWFTTYMGEFEKKIMSRIDNLVVKNNLKE